MAPNRAKVQRRMAGGADANLNMECQSGIWLANLYCVYIGITHSNLHKIYKLLLSICRASFLIGLHLPFNLFIFIFYSKRTKI